MQLGWRNRWGVAASGLATRASVVGSTPAFVQVGATTGTLIDNTDTVDITLPASVADGEFALILISTSAIVASNAVTDWGGATQIEGVVQGALDLFAAFGYKRLTAADSGGVITVTFEEVCSGCAQVVTFSGVSLADPPFEAYTLLKDTTSNCLSADITTLGINRRGIIMFATARGTAIPAPGSGWTERTDVNGGGSGNRVALEAKAIASVTTEAALSIEFVTPPTTDNWVSVSMALKPTGA